MSLVASDNYYIHELVKNNVLPLNFGLGVSMFEN